MASVVVGVVVSGVVEDGLGGSVSGTLVDGAGGDTGAVGATLVVVVAGVGFVVVVDAGPPAGPPGQGV